MKLIMYNMLKITTLAVLLLTTMEGYAQKKYPFVESTNVIVCREGGEGVKSSLIHPNWTTTPAHYEQNTTYNRVAAKLQVARNNVATTGLNWSTAVRLCASYGESSTDAGSWRLPTLRELRLIYVFCLMTKQASSVSVSMDNYTYWAATEQTTSNAWGLNFVSGRVFTLSKSSTVGYVRCVRDL